MQQPKKRPDTVGKTLIYFYRRHCEQNAAIQRFILKQDSELPRFARNDNLIGISLGIRLNFLRQFNVFFHTCQGA
jgi:hypothetical protein